MHDRRPYILGITQLNDFLIPLCSKITNLLPLSPTLLPSPPSLALPWKNCTPWKGRRLVDGRNMNFDTHKPFGALNAK
jgi:hypothetical protein